MHAMFIGTPEADKIPVDPVAMEQSPELVKSMDQITAEEMMRVMSHIHVLKTEVKIEGEQQEVTCPARKRLDTGREGAPGKYEDSADPVHVKIGALRIGDIALGSANAELYNMIGQQVKAGSKFHDTIMVTLTNGMANSGYVPTDDAFGRYTFKVLGSALKPGCAEAGIVGGLDGMIEKMNWPSMQVLVLLQGEGKSEHDSRLYFAENNSPSEKTRSSEMRNLLVVPISSSL